MIGKYESAIRSHDRALTLRPGWKAAITNREIARLRLEKLKKKGEAGEGTGGKLGADEIVFDNTATSSSGEEEILVGEGEQLSDEATQALWLRRVQTKPADFLRAKFAYQHQHQKSQPENKDGK